MFGTSLSGKWFWLLGLLVVSNIGYYLYNNWGLVTVKVTDAPLSKVINSIEWQGWVKIYSNLPPDTKVTMYVDHVSLADAMETLAANVDVPAPPDDGTNPTGDRPQRAAGQFGNAAGGSTNSPALAGGPAGGPPSGTAGPDGNGGPGGPPGGGRGGGGGFGRRAEWNLAFFIAPTAAEVKQEILKFENSDPDDSNKVFTAGGQMQLLASDTVTSAPDPRVQSWPGVKSPAPPSADNSTAAAPAASGTSPADPSATPDAPVPLAQKYLQDFAEEANIWIMAPGTWTPDVSTPPPADSSIIHAVEKFVSNAHGAMTQAIILRAGRGGARGGPPNAGGPANFAGNDDAWADRMRNAINGLPADQRPDALEQLNSEIDFRKKMRTLPADQRRQMMIQHFAERMLYADRSRLSPEKRAKAYQRMIALRQAAKAQK